MSATCNRLTNLFVYLLEKRSAPGDERGAAMENQHAICARHLGTTCPVWWLSQGWAQSQLARTESPAATVNCSKENRLNGELVWGKEPHTKTAHLKRSARGGRAGMNSNSPRPNSAILNYWWSSSSLPRFHWGEPCPGHTATLEDPYLRGLNVSVQKRIFYGPFLLFQMTICLTRINICIFSSVLL